MCNLRGCSIRVFIEMTEVEIIQKNHQHPQRKNTYYNFPLYYTRESYSEQSKV